MRVLWLATLLLSFLTLGCSTSEGVEPSDPETEEVEEEPEPEPEPDPEPEPFVRRVSEFEIDPPYITDNAAFWARTDLYIMRPDVEPLDRWPDEVLVPDEHGVKAIVFLPGDYRGRTNGSLPNGVLYIASSGTESEPLLITYASAVGADMLAEPHPAERLDQSQAQLIGFRVWNESYQYWNGLTFANSVSACWIRDTTGTVIDRCLWHETQAQPLRIRFGATRCTVQRCVMQRFDPSRWGFNDTVAIQTSDGACTHNRIVSNVLLNFTDGYQHTDRIGEDYGLGAGTIIDNNFMGFTEEARVQDETGERICGENALDFKMGGTEAEPVRVTNNVFFGARAAQQGCAASGSGGYAITLHRRGTWVEFEDNLFVDNDSGIFLNAFFLEIDASMGRIDPKITIVRNVFSGVRSYSTAFPSRTGHVLTGSSPATVRDNDLVDCERLMEQEAIPASLDLVIENNRIYGPIVLDPRDETRLRNDGNDLRIQDGVQDVTITIPWVGRTLTYRAPPAR